MPSPRYRSGATSPVPSARPSPLQLQSGFAVFLDKHLGVVHTAHVRQRSKAHAKLRSGRRGMISLRMVGTEVSALGAAALSIPLRFVVDRHRFDPSSPYPTPVVLVHGLFGDPTNFLLLPPHPVYGPHSAPCHRGGRVVVVPECGHWGLLIHPAVLREAAGFLAFPGATPQLAEAPLALGAAS